MTAFFSSAARGILSVLLLGLAPVVPALAQQPAPRTLGGEVVKGGEPVPGVEVTLHRVTREQSGEVARRTTDAGGRFEFEIAPADSGAFAVLFTTAEFHGIRYFGRAIHPDEEAADGYSVEVFDTASALPEPVRLSRRDMVLVSQPGGGWEVDEIIRLNNPNRLTLVSAGASPTWELSIPEGAEAFEVGESELPADQIQRMGDRVLLMLPLTPGEREMFIRYRIPPALDEAVLEFGSPADTFNLYVRQPAPRLEVAGLTSTNMVEVEGEQFLRYAATGLAEGSSVTLEWESSAPPVDPIVAAVVVSLLLLGVGVVAAVRGPGRATARPERTDRPASRELAGRSAE
jgi:hypothetical protein